MYEYVETDPSTWRFHEPPYLSPEWQEKLNQFAGLNRHGKPNLRIVWGGTCKNDKTHTGKELKYHAGWTPFEVTGYRYKVGDEWQFTTRVEDVPSDVMIVPDTRQEELGLLRFVIEKWIAPEVLEQQKRFVNRYAPGDLEPTLRSFPREGIYDTYFIVQTEDGKYRGIDGAVIAFLKSKWKFDQLPFEKQEELRQQAEQERLAAMEKKKDELIDAAVDRDLKLPQEEVERREEYWAKLPERRDVRGTHIQFADG